MNDFDGDGLLLQTVGGGGLGPWIGSNQESWVKWKGDQMRRESYLWGSQSQVSKPDHVPFLSEEEGLYMSRGEQKEVK